MDPKNITDPSSPWYQNPDWQPPDGFQYNGFNWQNGQPTPISLNTGGSNLFATNPDGSQSAAPGTVVTQQPGGATNYAPPNGGSSTPSPNGDTTSGPVGALPGGSLGSLLQPYGVPQPNYVQPDSSGLWDQVGAAPQFPTLPTFNEPTADQAANLPGYAFARDQGLEALNNSAAARGVTNTGGTLQDIVKFGDQFATQNYQTARANALEDYQNNIWAQYLAPYAAQQANWQTKAGLVPSIAGTANTTATNANNFNTNSWSNAYNAWRNNQNDTFNRLYALDTLGSGAA